MQKLCLTYAFGKFTHKHSKHVHSTCVIVMRKSSKLQCEEMAFVVWAFRLIVLLSIMWLRRRCAACRSVRLTMDMAWEMLNCRHKTACARIRLLLFESKSRWLSTVSLQRRTVWVRYRSRSFGTKLLGIGVRGNHDRLYARNSLSHLVTHFHAS